MTFSPWTYTVATVSAVCIITLLHAYHINQIHRAGGSNNFEQFLIGAKRAPIGTQSVAIA